MGADEAYLTSVIPSYPLPCLSQEELDDLQGRLEASEDIRLEVCSRLAEAEGRLADTERRLALTEAEAAGAREAERAASARQAEAEAALADRDATLASRTAHWNQQVWGWRGGFQ